uniref:Uncharacterized protein n=1 Tax=Anguilla anguilla TaxID=7936 RepID=A0A0E9UDT3_ANGAN
MYSAHKCFPEYNSPCNNTFCILGKMEWKMEDKSNSKN